MNWRNFKLPTPIDKIDKIDKTPSKIGFVDIVDIVDRVQPIKTVHLKQSEEKPIQKVMIEMAQATCDRIVEEHRKRGKASYVSNSEIQGIEDEITLIYHKVLDDKAMLSEYKQACDNWLNAVMANIGEC